ncbi:ABC transporter substrate-binding protein [Salipaludibacillus agaradhaerens]|uniref:ABC transporter substrate-binding protein n=1 Tax=Salipaludibacillus agaradhaerens TaxID=76935 RepID=A0A9Q4B2W7_SALAG|nr:ABC transporter substrate-binding protein [Salipaludibacillus agaradhaerens]MCR6097418.1 ABC transporter substrate-binding protein [Salipaludibacillus agaradhaerens]MCR6113098.1 ABC transporter substrate-binding protein [Salipaludibacillus agaradhaerens]
MKQLLSKWKQMSTITVLALILTACGAAEENNDNTENVNNDNNANETVEGNFPVTVTDGVGQEVTIEETPETIASLLPSSTEIVFELGAGDRMIGVSEYCNFPEETADIQVIGAQDMDAELILSLSPDLLLVQEYHYQNHEDVLNEYEEAGIDVLVMGSAESFEETYDTIHMIGEATGTSDEADQIVTSMEERLEEIREQAETISEEDRQTVWVEVGPSPDIFTTGQGTFMHEMLEAINATNAAEEESGWVQFTEEEIVTLEPDVIVTTYGYYIDNPEADVLARDGWSEVPAVQNERVYDVDNDTVTRPGPRLIEGVETLAKLVYPDVFE